MHPLLTRLRDADPVLLRELRRLSSLTILVYLAVAVFLFGLFTAAASSPHPVSLLVAWMVPLLPLLFRAATVACIVILVTLLLLRLYGYLRSRRITS